MRMPLFCFQSFSECHETDAFPTRVQAVWHANKQLLHSLGFHRRRIYFGFHFEMYFSQFMSVTITTDRCMWHVPALCFASGHSSQALYSCQTTLSLSILPGTGVQPPVAFECFGCM